MSKTLSRTLVTLGVGFSLFVSASGASGAGLARSSSTSTTLTTTTTLTSLKTYHQELIAYFNARRAIANAFKDAVSSARATFATQSASATTGAERSTARAAYDLAIAQAAATRSAALISLGSPPVRPS